MITEVRTF